MTKLNDPSTIKIKPCPFCGHEKQFVILCVDGYYTGCDNQRCRAIGPVRTTEDGAVKGWRRRE